MNRPGLTSSMFARLGLSVLACMSVPALVHGVAAVSAGRVADVSYVQAATAAIVGNPFGTIDADFGASPVPVASFDGFDGLRAGYFRQMMAAPVRSTPLAAATAPRAISVPASQLPIGCEPLGGVASHLDLVAGRCLS